MTLDSKIYPRTSKYIASLPQGLDSHSQCRINNDVYAKLTTRYPTLCQGDIPPEINEALSGEGWSNEVCGVAVIYMLRDAVFESDEQLIQWGYDNSAELFDRPAYRMFMRLLSPSLVVLGASKRWQAFRTGTNLKAQPVKKMPDGRSETQSVLTAPPGVYGELVLRQFAASFKAALDLCRADDVTSEYLRSEGNEHYFRATWR